MGFKIKYKQQLRDTVASGGGGGGRSSGATPPTSPPQEPAPSPRRSPSPPDAESKIPRRKDHCDPYDHSGQHGSTTKLYVGNMSRYTRERDLEAAFGRYGRLLTVCLQGRNYGFVVFYDPKDADAARNGLDGQEICGSHITVQFAREHKMTRYDTRYIHDDQNDRQDGNSKLFVSNISPRTQEHDIKDLFSKYGRVRKANLKENNGFVEFCDPQDADDARCELNGQKINGNRIGVKFATGVPRGPVDSAQILCCNCGAGGHFSGDCKAGDWKDRCYRCGEKGHLKRNCRNSPKGIRYRRRRSHSRSKSPVHGMGQSWRFRSRSRSYSSQPPSPRRGNRYTGGEELTSRSPCYSHNPRSRSSPPPPREPAKRSGLFHDALPRRGDNQNPGPNYQR
ncbi:serine/arginine-rich splicing factor RS2Z32-like isoform X1 [Miscanthus floridulus]|uniref:serine/arginine-rich splicing factor RS2Z32-like isoform X1 n=1 Tax=Miscanthus floridulus TaxID=154761 RepID=UPI00345B23A2